MEEELDAISRSLNVPQHLYNTSVMLSCDTQAVSAFVMSEDRTQIILGYSFKDMIP